MKKTVPPSFVNWRRFQSVFMRKIRQYVHNKYAGQRAPSWTRCHFCFSAKSDVRSRDINIFVARLRIRKISPTLDTFRDDKPHATLVKHKNVCEKIPACVFLRGAVLIYIFDVLSDIKENKYFMQKILDNFWCQTNIYSKKKPHRFLIFNKINIRISDVHFFFYISKEISWYPKKNIFW